MSGDRNRKWVRRERAARRINALRSLLIETVNALDAALYSDDEKRIDAAEETLDKVEDWLDEHPAGKELDGLKPRTRGGGSTRVDASLFNPSCAHGRCQGFPPCRCVCHGTIPDADPESYAG